MRRSPVITVDGPSGAGKGTLCRLLALRLGWHLLDSGSLYRLTALAATRRSIPLDDEVRVAAVAATLDATFATQGADEMRILLEGEEVTNTIRSEICGNAASRVATLPAVRAALLDRQRAFRRPPGLVADGRDMGTVVFPDADVKVFLIASAEERAARRYKQLREKGIDANLSELVEEIAERDARDAKRELAPLRPAWDAETLDTTGLSIEEVRARALIIVGKRLSF
jgi:cytidylate kinase